MEIAIKEVELPLQKQSLQFDSYEKVRAQEAFKKNPRWDEKIRELLQNIPWTDVMSEVQIKVNLLRGGHGFTLSIKDDDIGSMKQTFLNHLLKVNQTEFTTKQGDNRYGQGLQNMVLDTQHDPTHEIYSNIYIEMKPIGGVVMSATLFGDVSRSISWDVPTNPKIKSDSGWFVRMTFAGMSKRHPAHTPEGFVKSLYNILKEEYFTQLKNQDKKITIKLGGEGKWDSSFVKSFNDLDDLQAKTEYYYTDTTHTKLQETMHQKDGVSIKTDSGDDLWLNKLEYGKRPGLNNLMDRNIIVTEEEYRKNVYSAEMGDKPKITICSVRTGNVLHQAFFKNHPVHMNGMEWRVYIDIQDSTFESSSLTKTPFFKDDDERLKAIVQFCKDEWVEMYPDEKDAEQAYELWITEQLRNNKTSWVKKFYSGEVLYTVKDDAGKVVQEIRGLDGFDHYLKLGKQDRTERIINQFAKGPGIPDITMKMFDNNLMPTEVKPKSFTKDYINQTLGYFISAPEDVRQTVLWGYNLKPADYDKLNKMVISWKDGKLKSDDRFIYIDIRKIGFTDSVKAKYMKRVSDYKALQKRMKQLKVA